MNNGKTSAEISKDKTALEAVIADMHHLLVKHDFAGQQWQNNNNKHMYAVVAMAIREEDMAVLIVYRELVETKVFPEPAILAPLWARTVNNFLEKFKPLGHKSPGTFTPGYSLNGESQS